MPLQITGKLPVVGGTGDVLTVTGPTPANGRNPFIRVKAMYLSTSATSTVTVKSGSNEIGRAYLGTGNSYAMTDEREGLFDCEPGASLVINNSAGNIGGHIVYEIVGNG